MPLSVEYADLSLAQQVLERQSSQHLANMRSFLKEWCSLDLGTEASGQLLMVLYPYNEAAAAAGDIVLGLLEKAHSGAANHLGQTLDAYIDADEQIHNALTAATQALGGSALPFNDPRSSLPTLGAAEQRASKWYGGADPHLIEQMGQDIEALRDYAKDLPGRFNQRLEKAMSANRSISESQDASSYLVPPESPTSEMENLRWKAGPILGAYDWLIEKATGVSFLNHIIYKYTVGEGRVVDRAKTAGAEIGAALAAGAQHDSEILPALSEWTGKGSEAANAFIAALAMGTQALQGATSTMSLILMAVKFAIKEAAGAIGDVLIELQLACVDILVDASVPIAGWIKGVIDVAKYAWKITTWIMKAYKILNFLFDIFESIVQGKDQLLETRITLSNLAEAAARGIAARA